MFDLRFEVAAHVWQVPRRELARTSSLEERAHPLGDSRLAVANRRRRLQLRKPRIDNRGGAVDEALQPCVRLGNRARTQGRTTGLAAGAVSSASP